MTINAKNERSEQVANVVKKVIWVVVVLVFGYFYAWDRLLSSLDGSVFKTALIFACVIVYGIVNVDDMTGQPEKPHDH